MLKTSKAVMHVKTTTTFDDNFPIESKIDFMEIRGSASTIKAALLTLTEKIAETCDQSLEDLMLEMLKVYTCTKYDINLDGMFEGLNNEIEKQLKEMFGNCINDFE